jgi:hypothetical protein
MGASRERERERERASERSLAQSRRSIRRISIKGTGSSPSEGTPVRRGRPCDLEQDVPVAKRTRARPQGSIILRRRGPFATPAGLESRFSLSRPFPCPFRARPPARPLAESSHAARAFYDKSKKRGSPRSRLGSTEGETRKKEGKEKKDGGGGEPDTTRASRRANVRSRTIGININARSSIQA